MGKVWVEVSLISARGLQRSSSLWKRQWFAVGWIDPNNKYCTRIDASGNANPLWMTKFATLVDDSNFEDKALHVEVYRREPIFLTEKLKGTATILLKEFLGKYSKIPESSSRSVPGEGGSYQLRKRGSNKPAGFIDVSIRISRDNEEPSSHSGIYGEPTSTDNSNMITLSIEDGDGHVNLTEQPSTYFSGPENQSRVRVPHPRPYLADHPNASEGPPRGPPREQSHAPIDRASYHPSRSTPPPPPPPPSNAGYLPTFLPNVDYINMPSSATAPRRGANVATGIGAGALAAGAVIFGEDFMSGFSVPTGLQDPSLTISTDPPF